MFPRKQNRDYKKELTARNNGKHQTANNNKIGKKHSTNAIEEKN